MEHAHLPIDLHPRCNVATAVRAALQSRRTPDWPPGSTKLPMRQAPQAALPTTQIQPKAIDDD